MTIKTPLLLSDGGIEISLKEEAAGGQEEKGDTGGIDGNDGPESGGVAKELADDTAHKDAEPHADVPRNEDGRVSCATLVVRSHADGHILEGGPHVAIAQTDEQGRGVVGY